MITHVRYTVAGSGPLAVPFPYLDKSHVVVSVNGAVQDPSAYSWPTLGSIQLVTPVVGSTVDIARETPESPLTNFEGGTTLTSEELEGNSLQATYRLQEIQNQVDLSLQFPAGTTGTSTVLPLPEALKPLVWNASKTALENGSVTLTGDMLLRGNLADGNTPGYGAALVTYKRTGVGAVARPLNKKIEETISVEDFGAVGDGVADDTAAFLAARDHAATLGGALIRLTKPSYKITSTIVVTTPHILFQGRGLWINHDVGNNAPATSITWAGAAGGTMFTFAPVEGATNQRGTGGGLLDVALYGVDSAANGLVVKSWTNGQFRVYGANFNRTIVEVTVVTLLGEARDAQFNDFWIFGRQITSPVTPSTLILGGHANGTNVANASFNKFHEISTNYKDGVALDLYDSDSNWFGLVRLNSGAGAGKGMMWRGGTGIVPGYNSGAARGNYFHMLSVGAGGLVVEGTDTRATAAGGTIGWWDGGNGAPAPTAGPGTALAWANSGSVLSGYASGPIALAANLTTAAQQRALLTTETLRIYNSSSNHVHFLDVNNDWGLRLTGGNLTITRYAGSGFFDIAQDFRCLKAGFNGTAPIAKPAITGSRGGNAALASLLTALANYGLITDSTTA